MEIKLQRKKRKKKLGYGLKCIIESTESGSLNEMQSVGLRDEPSRHLRARNLDESDKEEDERSHCITSDAGERTAGSN
jgi:hypothetical protein